MITTEKRQLIIAALLHDIGKLYQRADAWLDGGSEIKDTSVEHLRMLVPFGADGLPLTQYAVWTYQFLENHALTFSRMDIWETELGKLSELSARYHQPTTEAEQLIQLASYWSAGHDQQVQGKVGKQNLRNKYAYKTTRLRAPFGKLSINGKRGSEANTPLTPLSRTALTTFPDTRERAPDDYDGYRADHREIWDAFVADFNRIPTDDADDFLFTLQQTLRKYLWCIVADTQDVPIVNLYEHLKTTAAFTACLYDYGKEAGLAAKEMRLDTDHYPVRMVCLDLSGIQSFIYDISSRKAFKSLKGRSYFLTALMDQMVDTILRETEQSYVNLLYASGGKAFLLLPNTMTVSEGLTRAKILLEDQSWFEEGGGIFPAMGSVNFTLQGNQVIIANHSGELVDLGVLWKTVSDLASQGKNRRYERILKNDFEEVFSEDSSVALLAGSTDDLCAVTGQPIAKGKGKPLDAQDNDSSLVTARVFDHIKVGRLLKDADYILTSRDGNADLQFSRLGTTLKFVDSQEARDCQRRVRLNDTDFLPQAAQSGAYGFNFYGGNTQPGARLTGGDVAEFEDLCFAGQDKHDKEVIEKLGVLRMDVDGLGQLFINGFAEVDKTLAAYATLSAQLDLFFSGYLNTIRESEEYQDTVSIVYSGGDDIFALGRWDRVLAFAERVREDFRHFVGRNDLTISGGLTIVDYKFPIYSAAAMAGEDEHKAKRHQFGGQLKNALTLFGVPLNWDKEFPLVKSLKNDLVRHINDDLSRAILHTIREAYTSSLPDPKSGQHDLSYKWQTAYNLKRMADRFRKRAPETAAFVDTLNNNLLHNDAFGADHYLKLAAVASRWAERTLKLPGNE